MVAKAQVLHNTARRILTGCTGLDNLLGHGLEPRIITQVYGPSASGKTNIAIQCAVRCVETGRKVIYIDTEGGFSAERLDQISRGRGKEVASKILLFEPITFEEQVEMVKHGITLANNHDIGLIVLDSAVALYRLEEGATERKKGLGRELGRILAGLAGVARRKNLAVLITNQVYASLENGLDDVRPVGGPALEYWSKVIIELRIRGEMGQREGVIVKHMYKPSGWKADLVIGETGFEDP